MKKIKLNQGKYALVDDDDHDFLNQWRWTYMSPGYARRNILYCKNNKPKSETILMHRLLMRPPNNLVVDHIDGNGLNNQKSNLRLATRSQNHHNIGAHVDNTSGYKGISWHGNKWRARLYINGKEIYVGGFKDLEGVVRAQNEAMVKHHGEFAKLNVLEES